MKQSRLHLARRGLALGLIVLAFFGGVVSPARSQESAPSQEDIELLRRRVSDREGELKAEKLRLSAEAEAAEAELSRLEAERDRRAASLLDALDREEEALVELGKLDSQLASQRAKRAEWEERAKELALALAENADQVRILLRDSPLERDRKTLDQLKAMAAEARLIAGELEADIGLSETDLNRLGERLAGLGTEFFAESDRAAAEARGVQRRRGTIRDAAGVEREVDLMALGRVAFAYRDGERYGLALASPEDAQGIRWSESLPDEVRAQLKRLFLGEDSATWPLDVNGVLAPEAVAADRGWRRAMRAGGWIMWPLAGLALLAVFLGVERVLVLFPGSRRGSRGDLAGQVRDTVREHADRGRAGAEEAAEIVLLAHLPRLERFLGTLSVIASVAPLLGLLGTVTGIIRSFGVIRAFGSADPAQLSGGISEALFTTAFGLAVAIPVLILHGFLQGRVDRLVAAAQHEAARALEEVQPS
jgi:biopolymer transport protein ExbB